MVFSEIHCNCEVEAWNADMFGTMFGSHEWLTMASRSCRGKMWNCGVICMVYIVGVDVLETICDIHSAVFGGIGIVPV